MTARYELSKRLFCAKMKEGVEVKAYVNSMIRLMEELESLYFIMDFHLQVDLILQSLSESFRQTITNFHMNKIECTIAELLNMLVMNKRPFKEAKEKRLVLLLLLVGLRRREIRKRKLRQMLLRLQEE